ncbi:MAG: adenylyl-sulfate kinase [Methanophagales archaeon ANME-1-THS]|nr:MAG: adenylyl-sulfate kinase [Methanophagales archaeon ANME-1-THS]
MTWAVWITGLPGSGKTVLAQHVRTMLADEGIAPVKVLELDEIRKFITPTPTYSEEEREIVYAALVYMAKLLVESGIPVIIDATGNRRRYRERARARISKFAEVYVKCPLDLCMERERGRSAEHAPSGIYAKTTEQGATVPGVNVPYEAPVNPEVVVDSETMQVEASARKVVAFIRGWYGKTV